MEIDMKHRNALANVFFDPNGIRGVWAAILFYGIANLLNWSSLLFLRLATIRHLIRSWSGMTGLSPHYILVLEALRVATVLIATAIIAKLQRRRWTFYGLDYEIELGQSRSHAVRRHSPVVAW
jgi:hypothetical protein